MGNYDLILRNSRVLTTTSDAITDVAISDEKIAAVGAIEAKAEREIDLSGRILSPGGVDVHCHIEQVSGMGLMNADTFETATRSALLGGTTTTVSFVPQTKATFSASLTEYKARAERGALTDHAFHLIVADISAPNALNELATHWIGSPPKSIYQQVPAPIALSPAYKTLLMRFKIRPLARR